MSRADILVVDDDVDVGEVVQSLLEQAGYQVDFVESAQLALGRLQKHCPDLVISDLKMPGMDGMSFLSRLQDAHVGVPVVMLTAHGTVELAVEAMKKGARDFVLKPFEREELLFVVKKALAWSEERPPPQNVSSGRLARLEERIDKAARAEANVLILGETGVGKGVAARRIHDRGRRSQAPFVTVHTGALPEQLLESELFGYEPGAFTGATTAKPGRVELAEGGTLFLDEIGDLSPVLQLKLLRLVQDRQYERLGGTESKTANVRFIAATHRDLTTMVKSGEFREDLFFRLNVIPVDIPPLRERIEEIAPLVEFFFSQAQDRNGVSGLYLSDAAMERLEKDSWPGNIRELENFIERLVVLADGTTIGVEEIEAERPQVGVASAKGSLLPDLGEARDEAERGVLLAALNRNAQNKTKTAQDLGVSRRTLYNKIKALGLVGI